MSHFYLNGVPTAGPPFSTTLHIGSDQAKIVQKLFIGPNIPEIIQKTLEGCFHRFLALFNWNHATSKKKYRKHKTET